MKPFSGRQPWETRRPAGERPPPVGSTVELVGQPADLGLFLGVAVEVGRTGEHAREEEGRIDRRQLALPGAATGLHVEEVVVEPPVAGRIRLRSLRAVAEEAQLGQGDRGGEFPGDHASLDEDRGGQASPTAAMLAGASGSVLSRMRPFWIGLVEVVLQRRQLEPIQLLLRWGTVQVFVARRLVAHRSALQRCTRYLAIRRSRPARRRARAAADGPPRGVPLRPYASHAGASPSPPGDAGRLAAVSVRSTRTFPVWSNARPRIGMRAACSLMTTRNRSWFRAAMSTTVRVALVIGHDDVGLSGSDVLRAHAPLRVCPRARSLSLRDRI